MSTDHEAFIQAMRDAGCPDHWVFTGDGTGGFHHNDTDWAWIGWQRGALSQAAEIARLRAECDAWRKKYHDCRRHLRAANRGASTLSLVCSLQAARAALAAIAAAKGRE
jgi:hypothetical protein